MAQASQLAQSTARQSVRSSQDESDSLVGAGCDCIEHISHKTVGYSTRDSANVKIAFEAAKVRRPLVSLDSLVVKGHVAVLTDFIIPRFVLQVEAAVRKN